MSRQVRCSGRQCGDRTLRSRSTGERCPVEIIQHYPCLYIQLRRKPHKISLQRTGQRIWSPSPSAAPGRCDEATTLKRLPTGLAACGFGGGGSVSRLRRLFKITIVKIGSWL